MDENKNFVKSMKEKYFDRIEKVNENRMVNVNNENSRQEKVNRDRKVNFMFKINRRSKSSGEAMNFDQIE